MKKLQVLVVVFSLLLFACEDFFDFFDINKEEEEKKEEPEIYKKFWACNISENKYYQIDAQMLAENELCRVWAEKIQV